MNICVLYNNSALNEGGAIYFFSNIQNLIYNI